MRKLFFTIILLGNCVVAISQINLVPNSSFELLNNSLNTSSGILSDTTSFLYIKNWFGPFYGLGADLFNINATDTNAQIPKNYVGYQNTHTGNGYAGIHVYDNGYRYFWLGSYYPYRRYISNKMESSLALNKYYFVSYYVSIANRIDSTSSYSYQDFSVTRKNINVYFSDTVLHTPRIDSFWNYGFLIPNITPSITVDSIVFLNDTSLWHKVSGIYKANGSEKFLTIGNFYDDNATNLYLSSTLLGSNLFPNRRDTASFYYIDDVSVIEVTHFIQGDSIKCQQDNNPRTYTTSVEFDKYLWSTGDTTRNISTNQSGLLWCRVTEGCSVYTDTLYIQHLQAPVAFSLGNDTSICINYSLMLSAPTNYSYQWNTGASTQSIQATANNTYTCMISNACGSYSDNITIQSHTCDLIFPTAFSPNGDQVNDVFRVIRSDYPILRMRIYNKWGQCVYEHKGNDVEWDGTFKNQPCAMDSYYYMCVVQSSGQEYIEKGVVELIR